MATLEEMRAKLAAAKEKINGSNTGVRVLPPVQASTAVVEPPSVPAEQPSITVQTDLQPTTLVVVERPAPSTEGSKEVSDKVLQSSETQLDIRNPVHAGFLQRLADLESCLLARDPLMKTHLGMIHKTMIEYEEIPNLLTIPEIRTIMEAQQAHTGVVLRAEVVKSSKAAATRKSAQIKIEDI